ncbi:MAG: hypothetical protein QM535_00055 [Limnohabitans sp.]|nr:hypothetical protein [Limnohabitans sp.]
MKTLKLIVATLILTLIACSKTETIETDNQSSLTISNETNSSNSETTFTTIKISGKIIPNNEEILAKGVCWSTNINPTINDKTISLTDNNFSVTIPNLIMDTKYNFRIYAQTKSGIYYGDNQSFSTLSLKNTNWKFATYYPRNQYTINSVVNFFSDGTTKFDELGSTAGLFITYGTWTNEGNVVTYIWEGNNPNNSTYVYTGTISGMTITGTFTHPSDPGTWNAIFIH